MQPAPAAVDAIVEGYLDRLGLEREPPSVDALTHLHRAHVERVPYETLWIHLSDSWGIDPEASARRIATSTRGGYCFHLNGAFSWLLGELGYDVIRHVGGVDDTARPSAAALGNHLVLTVGGFPTEAHPDGTWYVDVGLGDALHEPLPLTPGTYRQGPFELGLGPARGEIGDWQLDHDPAGAFEAMAWQRATATMDEFAAQHVWLSTSPDSGFVRVLTLQRRAADSVDILRGLVLTRIGAAAATATLETKAELVDVIGDVFGIDVATLDADRLAALWPKLVAAHEAWEGAGRP